MHCGASVPSPTARFCGECGTPVARGGQVPTVGQPARELTGERKFVTVLFADIKSSTEVAAGLDPEDWFLALERFHAAAISSIHEYAGIITTYGGDGVMALFGAPIAHEGHAEQACWAALRLAQQVEVIATDLAPVIGTHLGVRVGLNSGHVVVGRIGDDTRIDYTAQGLPVNIAARMEQIAAVGEVFLAPDTAALVRAHFTVDEVGPRLVKGVADPIVVHRLLGPTTTELTPASPTTSPLVGRTAELALLRSAATDARSGRPTTIALTAPPGFGKSRLAQDLLVELRARGAEIVTAVGDEVQASGPMWTVAELAHGVLGTTPGDGPDAIEAALSALAATGPAGAGLEDPGPVLGLLAPESQPPPVDPDTARHRMGAAFRSLVAARARGAADLLVLAVDDLHAVDDASLATLVDLVAEPPPGPLLILVTSRPSEELAARLPRSTRRIDLGALGPDEVAAMVRQWVDEPGAVAELARILHERTGGNPFFSEEILRSLAEDGRLVGPPGERRVDGALDGFSVPARVQTVIASRLDRLDPTQRELLQAAAVIGVEFDRPTLAAVAAIAEPEVADRLAELAAVELLRSAGSDRYAFRHRITQEVAYDTQLRDPRRLRHAAVAAAMEAQPEPERRASVVADHHERAGAGAEAARWYAVGAAAAARTDPVASLRQWQKVRRLTDGSDPDAVSAALLGRAELLTQGARVGMDVVEVHAVIEEARALAADEEHRPLLAFVLLRGWYALNGTGQAEEARALSEEAVAVADRSGIDLLSVGARLAHMSNASASGSVEVALALCAEADALLVASGFDSPDSTLRCQLDFGRGSLLVRAGRADKALVHLRAARASAVASGDPQWQVITRVGLLVALLTRGPGPEAQVLADEAMTIAYDICGAGERSMAERAVGLLALAEGDPARAIPALTEALAIARSAPSLVVEEMIVAALAEAHGLAGDPVTARVLADEAVAIARGRGNDNYELIGLVALARVLLAGPDPRSDRDEIGAALSRAEEVLTANGVGLYRPDIAQLTADLARVGTEETP